MKIKYLWVTLLALVLFGCDDNTGNLGESMMQDGDKIKVKNAIFKVTTRSILADSIYARTSTAYLGKYTDPDFGVFEADFMTQFNCIDNLTIRLDTIHDSLIVKDYYKALLYLYYNKNDFYGDSTAQNKLVVYELNNYLQSNKDYYYSAVDPEKYYNPASQPLGSKYYTIKDMSVKDSLWNTYYSYSIRTDLSKELANRIIEANKNNPGYFANSESFIQNVFKGVYVKHESGDGNILYLSDMDLILTADIYGTDTLGNIIRDKTTREPDKDSIKVKSLAVFSATKEVIQANRFQNSEKLKDLVAQNNWTYLKSPAGIFTEATLPIDQINAGEYAKDTLNSVQLSFTTYNETGSNLTPYKMPKAGYILMVRKKEMYSFFEKNELYDNKTSYVTTLGSNNIYKFSNINNLVNACIAERKEGESKDADWVNKNPDWNKIVLIPVSITQSSGTDQSVVAVSHDLKLTSAKLEGGSEGEKINLYVTYTTFK